MPVNDNACQISVDYQKYWIPCSRVTDLAYIDGILVNLSASSITLRLRYAEDIVYPYLSASAFSPFYKRINSQYNSSVLVTSEPVFTGDIIKASNIEYLILLAVLLIGGLKLLWKK